MNDDIIIRRASIIDVDFLTDTIIEAEKSGTDNLGLARIIFLICATRY